MGIINKNVSKETELVNGQIKSTSVQVIAGDTNLGVMATSDALRLAQSKQLDLVQISVQGSTPVCKVVDFGKYKYEKKKNRVRTKEVKVKEIQLTALISEHDKNVKAKHANKIIKEGNKVKIVVMIKGRQAAHEQFARNVLEDFITRLDNATLNRPITKEGNKLVAYI